MFCFQCEQTKKGIACTDRGVCGKDEPTAVLQDLLVHAAQGISQYAHRAAGLGARSAEVDRFVADALFSTVTNVNFDPERLAELLSQAAVVRNQARQLYLTAASAAGLTPESVSGPATWQPAPDRAGLLEQGRDVAIDRRLATLGADVVGLQELLAYGLKGAAAYSAHARILGRESAAVYAFFHQGLNALAEQLAEVPALLELNLRCGAISLEVLELLDGANTGAFGHPEPTPVRMAPRAGKAILVSGHDLEDLKALLEQTEGSGILVYTHGEMLPAHGYPGLKRFAHLAGHYGGAWMNQRREFDAFPGAILMTTNCIQQPAESYQARLFTSGLVAWPGVEHIAQRDFTPVIAAALAAPGFSADQPARSHTVGFGHHAVLGVAETVLDAVKAGAIKRFVLIGGCDGAESGRNYYTELAETMPQDWVVLTLGCGKFRVVNSDLGTIGGLPRLLDLGQCNDSYSAIRIAQALAGALGVGVNDLPLNLVISWYEQKAVCVLLALLHLGVRNIRLGPKLPAFLTPALLQVLVEQFNIMPIGTVADDLTAMAA